MSTLDFLFGGSAPASTTTYGQTVNNVPQYITDYTQGLLAQGNQIAAIPYQSYTGPRVAGLTDQQNQANQTVENLIGQYQSPLNSAIGQATNAGNTDVVGAASPYISQGASLIQQGVTDPSALMNPYVNNVINAAGVQAGQNFSNYVLPSIQNNFLRAGQYGSAGMQRAVGQQVNQTNQALQSQAQAALAQAYTQAQNSALQGGTALGQLGSTQGNLAALQGQLGLGAAQQLGSLASTGQNLGLQGASALSTIGQQQQNLNQQNLDLAYQDYQNQVNYPKTQAEWLSNLIRGVPYGTSSTSTSTTSSSGSSPSTISQIGSAASGLASLYDSLSSLWGG